MQTRLVMLVMVVMIGGCAGAGPSVSEIGSKPVGWKEAAIAAARSSYIDPYSVRDASISEPVPASMVFDGATPIPNSGWMVCIRANAKNRMGAYTGQQVTGILFQNGRIVSVINETDAANVVQHCGSHFTQIDL